MKNNIQKKTFKTEKHVFLRKKSENFEKKTKIYSKIT